MASHSDRNSLPYSQRAESELTALRNGIIGLASESILSPKEPQPMGGGITKLGKFEALRLETRFENGPFDTAIAWLSDSLRLRIRQGKYSSAVMILPERLSNFEDYKAHIITSHQRNGHTYHFAMQLKSKRRNQITISRPVAI